MKAARSPRLPALLLDLLVIAATAAALYVRLVGPIDTTLGVRPIHWSDPMRPLRTAVALLALRLALPWIAALWRRARSPALSVARKPYVWIPLAALALAAWPWSRHRAFERLAVQVGADRGAGHAQVDLATRPVLDTLEMIDGVTLPPQAAGRDVELACALPAAAAGFGGLRDGQVRVSFTVAPGTAETGAAQMGAAGTAAAATGDGVEDAGAGATGTIGTCSPAPGQWRGTMLRLPAGLPAEGRLVARMEGPDASRAARVVLISRPRLAPAPDPARLNLVLISLDTLRADHLGAYGYRRPVSPRIDALARDGALFERAIAQAPWTTPSHMSLFTSLFPSVHAVDSPTSVLQRKLGDDRRTLAETLRDAGYLTAAFTGSGSISAIYGFWRGFDVYDETDKDDPSRHGEDISGVYDKTSRWLEAHRDSPFFLFFHSYEAHAPFVHETFLDEVPSGAGEDDPRRLTALYDGDIRYADGFVGRLLDRLAQLGLERRTLVILLSDHGEELENRYPGKRFGHGHTQYDELLHVPLIIRAPGVVPAGLRVGAMVQIIDVMPTVLELLGLRPPAGIQGVSFAAALRGGTLESRSAFSEAINYGPERKALQDGRYKYIETFPRAEPTDRNLPVDVPIEEFFDLSTDPDERHSILSAGDGALVRLREQLQAIVRLNLSLRREAPAQRLDEETVRRLKALGYIQ